ncbi:hypothetical protein DSL92_08005 [Billgrantia gudaonensis]|uniref:Uncharacterized protein n=1 Tax=Billgrantia gudaonensis TaxID=376427 RepID=A0A432JIC8_9GAMM|nr:hypothetical protein DSL92_08005 [Halomonas gudaonensis]
MGVSTLRFEAESAGMTPSRSILGTPAALAAALGEVRTAPGSDARCPVKPPEPIRRARNRAAPTRHGQ